ncbi:MAG: chemotaxis protein CheW [Spirochaetaceae bacterium]|nr:chemotaxis protein CheW [Spirochaetaceae bacterium]
MEEKKISEEMYFTFTLGDGIFAVPVTAVREVLRFSSLTRVPKAAPYLKGVMNIRGAVVTVIDFRELFGFTAKKSLEDSAIIVTETPQENEQPMTIALVADDVDVVGPLEITKSDNANYGGMSNRREFIKCVGMKNGSFVLVLDLQKIFESIETEVDLDIA